MLNSKKIKSLQKIIQQKNFDGFLIPRSDCYQGEFISSKDERLKWLTGFTGSAGIAITSLKSVALFVDGRYTIQAKRESNSREIRKYNNPSY